jgi:RecA/RadA recombinase
MALVRKKHKKRMETAERLQKQETLKVVTVRISDEEKERIDHIMNSRNIKRYSDVMRMAVQMLKTGHIQ